MLIANPIYDVVFKYMMEDFVVARIFLSTILGMEITDIQFMPQEMTASKPEGAEAQSLKLTVYRLDFSARIRDKNGKEDIIIIEVQKTRLYGDIMRFRRYLGKQYLKENQYREKTTNSGQMIQVGIPIYSIYFLGTTLEGYDEHPIVHIRKAAIDHRSKSKLDSDHDFIKSLYHEGTIINIPALKMGRRREELEILLSIFDQENITEDMHIMNVQEQDFPERFRPIIRRLKAAVEAREVRDVMEIEDEFVREINEYENRIKRVENEFAREINEYENRIKRVENEFAREINEYENRIKQQEVKVEEALREKDDAQRQKDEAIRLLLKNGIPKAKIAEQLKISLSDIERLIK